MHIYANVCCSFPESICAYFYTFALPQDPSGPRSSRPGQAIMMISPTLLLALAWCLQQSQAQSISDVPQCAVRVSFILLDSDKRKEPSSLTLYRSKQPYRVFSRQVVRLRTFSASVMTKTSSLHCFRWWRKHAAVQIFRVSVPCSPKKPTDCLLETISFTESLCNAVNINISADIPQSATQPPPSITSSVSSMTPVTSVQPTYHPSSNVTVTPKPSGSQGNAKPSSITPAITGMAAKNTIDGAYTCFLLGAASLLLL